MLLTETALLETSSDISNMVLKGAFYLIELQLLQDGAFTTSDMQRGR